MAYAERKGLTVVHSYIDRALSAKTDARPQFQNWFRFQGYPAGKEFECVSTLSTKAKGIQTSVWVSFFCVPGRFTTPMVRWYNRRKSPAAGGRQRRRNCVRRRQGEEKSNETVPADQHLQWVLSFLILFFVAVLMVVSIFLVRTKLLRGGDLAAARQQMPALEAAWDRVADALGAL